MPISMHRHKRLKRSMQRWGCSLRAVVLRTLQLGNALWFLCLFFFYWFPHVVWFIYLVITDFTFLFFYTEHFHHYQNTETRWTPEALQHFGDTDLRSNGTNKAWIICTCSHSFTVFFLSINFLLFCSQYKPIKTVVVNFTIKHSFNIFLYVSHKLVLLKDGAYMLIDTCHL